MANSLVGGTSYTADEIAAPSVAETNYNCGQMVGLNYSNPGALLHRLLGGRTRVVGRGLCQVRRRWRLGYRRRAGVVHRSQADRRPIWLELSNDLPIADASTWHSQANGWRTTGDIECYSCWAPPYYASSHDT